MSFIPADNHMAVMAALFAIAALGFLAEKTRIGALLTGAVVAILGAIAASNLNIIPKSAPAYDFVFTYFVPVLIPLFLMKADLKRIFFETTRTTMAFFLAAVGTVAGVAIAVSILEFGDREAAVAGAFTATYIGGSVNYAALIDITGLREDASFVSAATATDNLFSALFLGMLAIVPGWAWLAKRFIDRDHSEDGVADTSPGSEDRPTAMTLTVSAAMALMVVALGDAITHVTGLSNWRYAVITALALIMPTAFPATMRKLSGGFELGVGLSFVFFAAIAAGADLAAMVGIAPLLMLMVLILLTVHAVIVFGLGSLLKLSLPELITASNAAVLGATTAPALAAAKGWKDLVTPGVLVGVFGYALGTFLGTGVYQLWGALTG